MEVTEFWLTHCKRQLAKRVRDSGFTLNEIVP